SQQQHINRSYRYWELRQRLLDRYVKVGDCHGCSLPATLYNHKNNALVFHDESVRQLGWYIAVLASENYLLRSSGATSQQLNQNLQELYYAVKAFDRLDKYAEFLWCIDDIRTDLSWNGSQYIHQYSSESCEEGWDVPEDNLNGFFIREDVPPFWEQHYPGNVVSHGKDGWIFDNEFKKKPSEMSQDQTYHFMLGLAFIRKFIEEDTEYQGLNFRDWASATALRLRYAFSVDFRTIRNPVTTNGVNLGSNGFAYCWLMDGAVQYIMGDAVPEDFCVLTSKATSHLIFGAMTGDIGENAGVNQNMLYLMIALSDLPAFTILNLFNPHYAGYYMNRDLDYHYDANHFYGNIYRVLHENDPDLGLSSSEIVNLLYKLDCQGPYYYQECVNYNWDPVLKICPEGWTEVLADSWDLDNSFNADEADRSRGSDLNGHYNGLDAMLAYNVYLLQENLGHTFLQGADMVDAQYYPIVEQHPLPNDEWSQLYTRGSSNDPVVLLSANKITVSAKYDIVQYPTRYYNGISWLEPYDVTYYGEGYYRARNEIDVIAGFDAAFGTNVTFETGPEPCDFTYLRLGEIVPEKNKPLVRYNVIDHHLDEIYSQKIYRVNQKTEQAGVFPNPCHDFFNLKITSEMAKQVSLRLYSLDGKLQRNFHQVQLNQGLNQPSFSLTGLEPGIYQLVLSEKGKSTVLRLVKL
ncbi:MAG: T9SS type A sorting domain-containing protein, partial [Bacteroidia bacterium]|nr:T9SS type A sorting domain-containing protein [Bacteroidia bacterium]